MRRLHNRLHALRSSSLARNLGITFTETVLTKGLNFGVILMLTRTLGPEDYGKYSLVFVVMAFCSAFFDFGMENTAVRFASRERAFKNSIFGIYFLTKLGILAGLILFFVCFGASFFRWMGKGDVVAYMPFLILGLLGESLFFVNDTFLQANQHFTLRALLNISRYLLLLAWIGFLTQTHQLTLERAFYGYGVPVVFLMFFLGTYVRFIKAFFKERLRLPLWRDMVHYEKWMFLFSMANNAYSRVDFLILSLFVSYSHLGIYNAALQLSSIVSFIPFVFGKVLLPKMAEMQPPEIFASAKRITRPLLALVCGAALLIPLAGVLVPLFLGASYAQAVPLLQWMLIGTMVQLLAIPYQQALYSLGKPNTLAFMRYVHLVLVMGVYFLLIPHFGMTAAAVISVLGQAFYLGLVYRSYSRLQRTYSAVGQELYPHVPV